MSLLHLAPGSQQPPKVDGKLRLYSMQYCPYAQRTRLVLNAKKVPHDIVNIDLRRKPEWYFKIHPEGKVPALDTGSEVIVESLVIADYLDDKYPEPPLYSKDPNVKKRDKELIEKIAPIGAFVYSATYKKEEKSLAECIDELNVLLKDFESELASRETTFFGGEKPGMVDYMLWPWGERMSALPLILGEERKESNRLPLLKKWSKAMKEDPPTKAALTSVETLAKIAQKVKNRETVDLDNL